MQRTNALGLGIGALALVASSAFAAPLFITNASFEDPVVADGGYTGNTNPGWSGSTFGTQNPTSSLFTGATGNALPGTATGDNDGYLNTAANTNPFAVQSDLVLVSNGGLSATIADNTTYTLTVAIGKRSDYPNSNAKIEILSNLASATATTILAADQPVGTFSDFTATFTTAPSGDPRVGTNLRVQITATSPDGGLSQLNFDNVRLDAAAVPEPAAMSLLGFGGISLLARRRR